MKNTRIKTIVACSFFLLLPIFSLAGAPTDPLIGVWQHTTFVQTADGKVVRKFESVDGTKVEYRADGTWHFHNPPHASSGTYRWIGNGRLESTILKSDLPNQVGFISIKKATVDEQTLVLVTEYDADGMKVFKAGPDRTPPRSMTITSTFRKVGQ